MPSHIFFEADPAPDSPTSPSPSTSKRPALSPPPSPPKQMKRPRSASSSSTVSDDNPAPTAGPAFSKSGKVVGNTEAKLKRKEIARRAEAARLEAERRNLPIWPAKDKIIQSVRENDTVVILGETGSGKTTQVPQFLLGSSDKLRICCTQPRRVAATTLATRVSAEVGCEVGGLVGYTVRFDDRSSQRTRLKYLTDGALLAEMLGDRDLERYDVIILDEAHERTLRTDMLLGFLKESQARRKLKVKAFGESSDDSAQKVTPSTELKIIVMSATIDAKRFSDFFDRAPVLYVKGRQYPVQLRYTPSPIDDYHFAAVQTFFDIHIRHPPGDVLIFLPGQDDIEAMAASISSYLPSLATSPLAKKKEHVLICPLFAKLAPTEQAKAFAPAPPNTRKVILATNVAETSITIPGVVYVIDSGLAKEKEWHAAVGIESLMAAKISQSSAQQRLGRAGRERRGWCFRLYTEADYIRFERTTKPEIKRVSLVFALLHLLAAGNADPFSFPYMDPPTRDSVTASMVALLGLNAISPARQITPLGAQMSRLPLSPELSAVLLSSFGAACSLQILQLVSLLSARDTLLPMTRDEAALAARQKFIHRTGDHWTLLNVLRAYNDVPPPERKAWCKANFVSARSMTQVIDTMKQLRERCEKMGLAFEVESGAGQEAGDEEVENVLSTLIVGLFMNTAIRRFDGSYQHTLNHELIVIHPGSSMHLRKAPAIIYDELVLTTKIYARGVSAVELAWIPLKAPGLFAAHSNFGQGMRS